MIDIERITNDFIDSFSIDLEPGTLAPGLNLERANVDGIFRSASTILSFQLECQPGFIGESCVSICTTDPCSNNGTCIQNDTGFTCVCTGDFTGDTCETRIESADTTTATVTDATTTSNSNNSKRVLIGAVGGSIITFIIIGIIIITVVLRMRRIMAKSPIGKITYT